MPRRSLGKSGSSDGANPSGVKTVRLRKHDNRDYEHLGTARFICLFLGAKVEIINYIVCFNENE
ncbi:hypothetical protein ACFQ5E_12365 [Oceanobacillus sojae]